MPNFLIKAISILLITITYADCTGQTASIKGTVYQHGKALPMATVQVNNSTNRTMTDSAGHYHLKNIPAGTHTIIASHIQYKLFRKEILLSEKQTETINISLEDSTDSQSLEDVVISGTMKPVIRSESPVPVEVYTSTYFRKNPTPNIFDALQIVNGVRPQLNCNVCNTGDIHINGLEGPYTIVLIDGMPIVSSLGTVYGLSGIPNSLVERIEVVKGPASSLYGSEAVGGLINIITKKPAGASLITGDIFGTTYGEYNADLGFRLNVGKRTNALTGINYFNFQNRIDKNNDNFTDVTLQNRISIFQKWNIDRDHNRLFSFAGRYMYEDRWGGDMRWNKTYRGDNEIYGESIYTNRAELIGNYQLPVNEKMYFAFSFINHDQDSRYGNTSYIANQKIAFGQLTWDKKMASMIYWQERLCVTPIMMTIPLPLLP